MKSPFIDNNLGSEDYKYNYTIKSTAFLGGSSDVYDEILNISGEGTLNTFYVCNKSANTDLRSLKVTVDSNVIHDTTNTGTTDYEGFIQNDDLFINNSSMYIKTAHIFNMPPSHIQNSTLFTKILTSPIKFKSSLKVELKTSSTTFANMYYGNYSKLTS